MKVYEYPFPEGTTAALPALVAEVADCGRVGFVSGSALLGKGAAARIRKACGDEGIEVDYDWMNLPQADVFAVFPASMGWKSRDYLNECAREAKESGMLDGLG